METLKPLITKEEVVTVKATQRVLDACELMQKNNIGAIVITRNKKPLGIFSERDLLNRVVATGKSYTKTKINDVMTTDVKTADISTTPEEAYNLMTSNNIRHLPVVKNGNLAGMISIRDLLRFNFLKKVTKEKIETWMTKGAITAKATQRVSDACELMQKNNIGAIIVAQNKKPIGVFSERDVLNRIVTTGKSYTKTRIKDVMTAEVKTADVSTTPDEAFNLMTSNNIRHLPIVKKGNLIGIVSIKDLLRFNMRVMEQVIVDQAKELNFLKDLLDKTPDERTKELVKKNKELENLVAVDGLTELFNHKCFEKMLEKEVIRSQRYKCHVSLLFIDIDHFKHYNDTNGHEHGNVLLKQIAKILSKTSRRSDTIFKLLPIDIVARYGGEEFVLFLPETTKKRALERARRLLEDIRNYDFYNAKAQPGARVTVSIGIAEFPGDASNWKELIKKADEALYRAKETGRNRICV